jgi:hypothetical protein
MTTSNPMNPTKTIEVRDGTGTVLGTIQRKVTEAKTHWVSVNGESLRLQDPHGECFVYVASPQAHRAQLRGRRPGMVQEKPDLS